MDKFYVIKLINRQGERGYLIDGPDGILIAKGGIVSDIKQFPTYQDAQQFLRDRKIERRGVKAYIRDNEDLMKDEKDFGAVAMDKPVYYLEDDKGNKCFYDTKQEGYYFSSRNVGYCCWETRQQLEEFIRAMEFPCKTFIKTIEPKK